MQTRSRCRTCQHGLQGRASAGSSCPPAIIHVNSGIITRLAACTKLSESYLDDINTGNVPESLGDALVLVVDDKGTQLLDVTAVPQLSLASAHAAGGVDPIVRKLGKNTNCINSYKRQLLTWQHQPKPCSS